MRTSLKRMTSLFLALVMVFTLIPTAALAADISPSLVSNLAAVYDGDEERAREELEALYEAGIIDEDGNMVSLDVREDGERVELAALAERIANGGYVGEITVNGNAATSEQILQISEVSAMLELLKALDEDVEITDEHVANLEDLIEGIADGSVDLESAIESGELRLSTRGSRTNADLPEGLDLPETATDWGEVGATGGVYTDHYISESDYNANYAFTLTDPENATWYSDSSTDGLGLDGVVTLSCADTATAGGTVTVTATLDKAQSVPVSFDYAAAGGAIGASGSGTVTWKAGESGEKTFEVTVAEKEADEYWHGQRAFVINAGNIQNATFAGGKTAWSQAVTVEAADHAQISAEKAGVYAWVQTESYSNITSTSKSSERLNGPEFHQKITTTGEKIRLSINYTVAASSHSYDNPSVWFNLTNSSSTTSGFGRSEIARNVDPGTHSASHIVSLSGNNNYVHYWFSRAYAVSDKLNQLTVLKYAPPQSASIESVSVPAGTYYSGEVVPVTVHFSTYIAPSADTKLTVNGVSCPLLDVSMRESKTLTFGYTVKAVDTGSINVTALTGGITNYDNDKDVKIDGSFPTTGTSFGTDEGVTLASAVKASSLDLTNVTYGIDNGNAGEQIVTVVVPFQPDLTDADKAWVTNEAVAINDSIDLPVPGYSNGVATHYLAGAYFSNDGGATRYPVYVVNSGASEGVALAARFVPPMNESSYLRKDTLDLFMDPQTVIADTGATKYLPAWGDMEIDGMGFAYAEGGDEDAPALLGANWSYYVKGGVFFEEEEYIDRVTADYKMDGEAFEVYSPHSGYSFLKKNTGEYVLLQDAEHPEHQYDVEIVANEDFYNALANGVRMEGDADPQLSLQFTNRKKFTFTKPENFTWMSDKEKVAVMNTDDAGKTHVVFVGPDDGEVKFSVVIKNGTKDHSYELDAGMLIALAGKEPFLNIPKFSQLVPTLTGVDTDVLFASNVTARNAALDKNTTFTATLYEATEDPTAPNGYVKTGNAIWTGDFTSTVDETRTHVTVPGGQLSAAGVYAVEISTYYFGGEIYGVDTEHEGELSATAFLDVKQAPVKVTLDKLDSYSVTSDEIPTIGYTATGASTVEYTIQKSGEALGGRETASGGTIPFAPGTPQGLKDVYTITVYARNSDDDPWSVDSMLLTVYNEDALDIIIKEVVAGEIGGTTGGVGDGVKDETVAMDNHDKLSGYGIDESSETESAYQLTFEDFQTLRTDMSLQKIISANYGTGVWGLLSDKMEWDSSDPATVSVDYKQGGIYSDIRNYSYVSYAPSTDFLLVGKDKTNDEKVTITATHANTGMSASIDVTTTTLTNQLYVFQFYPKTTTTVTYTNGKGVKREELKSNANGELAVYEPDGIKGAVMATSTSGGDTYVGTIYHSELESGERDVASLQLYPCNNLRLRAVANAALTLLMPDGSPYSGSVTIRAGVYKNGTYCPGALVKTTKDAAGGQNGREDIAATASNGKLNLWFDPLQFNIGDETGGLQPGDTVTYVIEYRSEGYRPGYVILNAYSDLEGAAKPTDSIIQLYEVSGTADQPQISKQVMQQYYDGDQATGYDRDVTRYMDNIGVSAKFNKTVLYTTVSLPGEAVTTDEKGYTTYTSANVMGFELFSADGDKLTGQIGTKVEKEQPAKQIIEMADLDRENIDLYVFPFSSVPMMQSTYTMTDANLSADGITDTGSNPTVRVKAHFTSDDLTIRIETMPFGVSNLSHQKDLSQPGGGAKEIAGEVNGDLKKQMNIGDVFKSVGVNAMLQSGFAFLSKISGSGDSPINMIIMPTQDPAVFRIVIMVGSPLHEEEGDSDGVSVNYDPDKLAEDAYKFGEELEKINESKGDDEPDDDDGGEGKIEFRFSGTLYLTAKCDIVNNDWDISFTGGTVGTSIKATYSWSQNFMCGPVPFFVEFEIGAGAKIEVSFLNKEDVRAMLLDTTLNVSLMAFAGLGFDLSLVEFKLGIEGRIGAAVNFQYLTRTGESDMNGTKLSINGSVGIKMKIKVLFVSYSTTFASTGFGWSKTYGQYDDIQQAWKAQGFAELNGKTQNNRYYSMILYPDGTGLVAIEDSGEIENRDYLSIYERAWSEGISLRSLRGVSGGLTEVQSNAYPYSNPVFVDDGSMFLYISDNDNEQKLQSVVSYATAKGNSYEDQGALATDTVLADSDVVASGSGENYFAAWVKQMESPDKEMHAKVTNDDLGMMMNATEVYFAAYDNSNSGWTTIRLTENNVADMAPTVASYGDKAIVAWRSMKASSLPAEADFTKSFDVENYINYRIYNGGGWTEAQIAYNGSAGTVNAIDSAMLSDGTAMLVYTVRTGAEVTSTETFYTLIDTTGDVITTGRLTNDKYTDTNAQVAAVDDQFVVGWYTEYSNGENMHDVRLARINKNGSVDDNFPECIGSTDVNTDFRFSAPAKNTSLSNLAIVWPESGDEPGAMNAVRFFEQSGNIVGITAQTTVAEIAAHFTVDHFDAYTDGDGNVHTLILGSDYSGISGVSKYDTIDLTDLPVTANPSSDDSSDMLNILSQTPETCIKLGSGHFSENAIEAEANFDIDEVMPGLNLPVQFSVKNTGTEPLDSVTVYLENTPKTFNGVNLLPNQSTMLTMTHEVPDNEVRDVHYTVTAGDASANGTLMINRPDVGIAAMTLQSEGDGERDILVRLYNSSNIPLAGSGKYVKLAFYKDDQLTEPLGETVTVSPNDYALIDDGVYIYRENLKVRDVIGDEPEEIPDEGATVYAKVWIENDDNTSAFEELNTANNTSSITFNGLLKKYGEATTVDSTLLPSGNGGYTVRADIRNNSMQRVDAGIPVAVLLDSEGKEIARKNFQETSLPLTEEERTSISVPFTAGELDGEIPAKADFHAIYTVTFDLNDGSGEFAPVNTDFDGHILLPQGDPTPPESEEPLFFNGWYTKQVGGERVTENYTFTKSTKIYAQYVTHQHSFTYTASGATITAKCTEDCPEGFYETPAKLTIVAPAPIFGGKATLSGLEEFNAATKKNVSETEIKYVGRNDTVYAESTTAPTDAGEYTASITVEGETVRVDYTVGCYVDVVNGTGSGWYNPGEIVTIIADAQRNKIFSEWITDADVEIRNPWTSTATFVMPAQDVTVAATYHNESSFVFTYPIVIETPEHGTVKSSHDRAAVGTTVTITVKPDAGYETVSITVTDKDGERVAVTNNGNGTYSFTMPSGKVTVKAEFSQQAATDPFTPFSDLDRTAWYADGVRYVLENSVMQGTGDGLFQPNLAVSRAQMAQILWNLEGKPATSASLNFTDVKAGDWFADAVRWASDKGIVGGYGDGTFGPNDAMTREQLVTILYRYAKLKGVDVSASVDLSAYPDAANISDWAKDAMQWAVGSGLINGIDSKLEPQGSATRAQIATIIMRYQTEVAK